MSTRVVITITDNTYIIFAASHHATSLGTSTIARGDKGQRGAGDEIFGCVRLRLN